MIQPIYINKSTDLQKSSLTPENKSERLKRGWGAGADRNGAGWEKNQEPLQKTKPEPELKPQKNTGS